jgi:nucleotidyltransferase/DNA polymerase involved in DNA repair
MFLKVNKQPTRVQGKNIRNRTQLDKLQFNHLSVALLAVSSVSGDGANNRRSYLHHDRGRVRKSVGAENTFSQDLTTYDAMLEVLQPLIDKVWQHCESSGARGRIVTLKVVEISSGRRDILGPPRSIARMASLEQSLKAGSVEVAPSLWLLSAAAAHSPAQAGAPPASPSA